jgi:hypothetical protein
MLLKWSMREFNKKPAKLINTVSKLKKLKDQKRVCDFGQPLTERKRDLGEEAAKNRLDVAHSSS